MKLPTPEMFQDISRWLVHDTWITSHLVAILTTYRWMAFPTLTLHNCLYEKASNNTLFPCLPTQESIQPCTTKLHLRWYHREKNLMKWTFNSSVLVEIFHHMTWRKCVWWNSYDSLEVTKFQHPKWTFQLGFWAEKQAVSKVWLTNILLPKRTWLLF